MAGKLNFWNDGYITIFGISYHVSDLLLSIKTTMRIRIYIVPRLEVCTCPPGTHLRQSGIFLYLYTPAMIFSQMPVEHIQLVHGEVVDKFFDIFHGIEIPAHVQHQSPPTETGAVNDIHRRKGDLGITHLRGNELVDGLDTVEYPTTLSSLDNDALVSNR